MARHAKLSGTYLIADARERAVIPFIEQEFREHAFLIKQVTTADYLICKQEAANETAEAGQNAAPGTVLLCAIERKSHEDFAASFKDGRHDNVRKLIALRAATGCALFYFVEGPAFPDPKQRFSGIPFANILAAMTRLMVSDGIFVVQTECAAHSAQRLLDFVRAFDSAPAPAVAHDATALCLAVPEILTRRAKESDREAAVCMWSRLDGVSVTIGTLLSKAVSVAELAARAVGPDEILALRTENARPINKEAVASLLGLRDGSIEIAVSLLSGLRGITPPVARVLLEACGGLSGLCAHPGLAAVPIEQKTRSVLFGKARAERVTRILHYKEPGATEQ
jgi:ERCC4-type nuclease